MVILFVKFFFLLSNVCFFGNYGVFKYFVLIWIFFYQINDDKNCNYFFLVDFMMNVVVGGKFKQVNRCWNILGIYDVCI